MKLKRNNREKKYLCKFHTICNSFRSNSESCNNFGGVKNDFEVYCGKFNELNQKIKTKKELKKIEIKTLEMEIQKAC